jgi:L-methionine (R)-S-oxide reductase
MLVTFIKSYLHFIKILACSSSSKSEIVVPIICDSNVVGVLDVDSDAYDFFDQVDKEYLERITLLLSKKFA